MQLSNTDSASQVVAHASARSDSSSSASGGSLAPSGEDEPGAGLTAVGPAENEEGAKATAATLNNLATGALDASEADLVPDRPDHGLVVWLHETLVDPGYLWWNHLILVFFFVSFLGFMPIDSCNDLAGARGDRYLEQAIGASAQAVSFGTTGATKNASEVEYWAGLPGSLSATEVDVTIAMPTTDLKGAICFHIAELRTNFGWVNISALPVVLLIVMPVLAFAAFSVPKRVVDWAATMAVVGLVMQVFGSNLSVLIYPTSNNTSSTGSARVSVLHDESAGDSFAEQLVAAVSTPGRPLWLPAAPVSRIARWLEVIVAFCLSTVPIYAAVVAAGKEERAAMSSLRRERRLRQLLAITRSYADSLVRTEQEKAARKVMEATLGYAAHELRNPLFVIANVSDGLEERMQDCVFALSRASELNAPAGQPKCERLDAMTSEMEAMMADMTIVNQAVTNMRRVTDDVLDHQKLASAKLELRPTNVDIQHLLAQVVARFDPTRYGGAAASAANSAATPAAASASVSAGSTGSGRSLGLRPESGTRATGRLGAAMPVLGSQAGPGNGRRVVRRDGIPTFFVGDFPGSVQVDALRLEQLLSNGFSNAVKNTAGISVDAPAGDLAPGQRWLLDPRLGGIWLEARLLQRPVTDQEWGAGPAAQYVDDGILRYWIGRGRADKGCKVGHGRGARRNGPQPSGGPPTSLAVTHSDLASSTIPFGANSVDRPMELHLSVTIYNTSRSGLSGVSPTTLFRPFEQGAGNGRTLTKGTGLGLPICRLLARLMGGGVGLTDVKHSAPVLASPVAFTATAPRSLEPIAGGPRSLVSQHSAAAPRASSKLGRATQSGAGGRSRLNGPVMRPSASAATPHANSTTVSSTASSRLGPRGQHGRLHQPSRRQAWRRYRRAIEGRFGRPAGAGTVGPNLVSFDSVDPDGSFVGGERRRAIGSIAGASPHLPPPCAAPELYASHTDTRSLIRQAMASGLVVTAFTVEVRVSPVEAAPVECESPGVVEPPSRARADTDPHAGSKATTTDRQEHKGASEQVLGQPTPAWASDREARASPAALGAGEPPVRPVPRLDSPGAVVVRRDGKAPVERGKSVQQLPRTSGLPVALLRSAPELGQDAPQGGAAGPTPSVEATMPGQLRVALVDDEPLNRMVTKRLVKRVRVRQNLMDPDGLARYVDIRVEQELADGSELLPEMAMTGPMGGNPGAAEEAIGDSLCNVVLMDLNMQHENGQDTALRMRQAGCTACIVACTGDLVQEDQLVDRPTPSLHNKRPGEVFDQVAPSWPVSSRELEQRPFDAVLCKPYDHAELSRTISRGLLHAAWAWRGLQVSQ